MSTVRLYYPENIIENSTSLLSKEHTHYIVNVMRLKRGSKINFFNKEGEWLSEIVFLDRDRVEIKFLNKIKESFPASNIELAICLVKKNPMEIILQKATELGVSRIIPIISERTEVKDLNLERANKITIEATEQSNQLNPPKINQMINLKNFINSISKETKLFFADINSKYALSSKDLEGIKNISILLNPIIPDSTKKVFKTINVDDTQIKIANISNADLIDHSKDLNDLKILFKKIENDN